MDIGIHNFLIGKHILSKQERIKVLKSFTKKYGTQAQDDFTRFATFIDQGIRSGEFKGKPVKLLSEHTKQRIEEDKEYAYYKSKISQSIKSLYFIGKNNTRKTRKGDRYVMIEQLLINYFKEKDLPVQQSVSAEANVPKYFTLQNWFQTIIDNNLEEDFTLFCKGE